MIDDNLDQYMEDHLNGGYGDILEPWDDILEQQELEDFADDNYFEQYEIDEF